MEPDIMYYRSDEASRKMQATIRAELGIEAPPTPTLSTKELISTLLEVWPEIPYDLVLYRILPLLCPRFYYKNAVASCREINITVGKRDVPYLTTSTIDDLLGKSLSIYNGQAFEAQECVERLLNRQSGTHELHFDFMVIPRAPMFIITRIADNIYHLRGDSEVSILDFNEHTFLRYQILDNERPTDRNKEYEYVPHNKPLENCPDVIMSLPEKERRRRRGCCIIM